MSTFGVLQSGVIVPEKPLPFPEGSRFRISIDPDKEQYDGTGLASDLLQWAGQGQDLPADLARNHDHYLHGTDKK
ncbi:MAG: hypothetical protein QM703_05970 [Gemmatales bacterium]